MSPKTSITLCTYNEANYIENAILEIEKNNYWFLLKYEEIKN